MTREQSSNWIAVDVTDCNVTVGNLCGLKFMSIDVYKIIKMLPLKVFCVFWDTKIAIYTFLYKFVKF